ncbi:MAG: MaoC family dehydratase N-terminal domain-containing protein [Acidimicrobiaceae bacterium]|nr:MaoC family dehydratase N-terminal domain-containing protein [Acidimicrobiaceae bacterium]
MSHITAEMAAAVGSETGRRVSFPVSASDIRRWAVAVYWPEKPPRLFWDEAYARTTRHRGIVAPEEFNPFAWMVAEADDPPVAPEPNDTDMTERILGIEGPGLKFQLNGGLDVSYGVRIRPGDVITATSRLAEYREREGRLGLMLFTVSEATWINQRSEVVKSIRMTGIRY